MAHEIPMPKLSDSMEEGRIVRWLRKEGDPVSEGEIIAEIESDKAVMELESFAGGTLQKILHREDDVVPVGEAIAVIAEEGEQVEAPQTKSASAEEVAPKMPSKPEAETRPAGVQLDERPAPRGRPRASPLARALAERHGVDLGELRGTGPEGRIVKRDVLAAVSRALSGKEEVAEASAAGPQAPAERKVAGPAMEVGAETLIKKYGLDAGRITGTGLGGRVTVADVLAAHKAPLQTAPKAPDEELPAIVVMPDMADVEPASYWQLTAARRTVASKHVIPHFYLTNTVNAAQLVQLKNEKKEELGATLTHYVIRACVKALEKYPQANWSYDRGQLIKWKDVHIGLAVQAEAGLVVAVIHNAKGKGIRELVNEVGALVERARQGRLRPEERQYATFTISNLGMFGVESFQAIINPPSACTLSVGAVYRGPIVTKESALAVADLMKISLSADHRLIDGVLAAQVLAEIRRLLETPQELLE